ncbi:MAG: hypothetical protein JEY71_07385 [Sphaerochaeta sp.]|nr:hypothetical protein [Sphaerochaeta sp.]
MYWGILTLVLLQDLFSHADVISLHCPLTTENVGFVNMGLLSMMKKTAFLINTSRGQLINERYQYPRASPGKRRRCLLSRAKGLTYLTLLSRHSLGNGPMVMLVLLSLRWGINIITMNL